MHYVMTDIHGEYEKLMQMLHKIGFSDEDTLYLLGDLVDRGPDSVKVVEFVRQSKNIRSLMGNHELMLKEALKRTLSGLKPYYIFEQSTIDQFFDYYSEEELLEVIKWMDNMPYFFEYGPYVMVHSGLSIDPKNRSWDFNKTIQEEDDYLWSRASFYNYHGLCDKIVLFGHTPTCNLNSDQSFKVWRSGDKVGLDCGVTFEKQGGKLACFCIEKNTITYL